MLAPLSLEPIGEHGSAMGDRAGLSSTPPICQGFGRDVAESSPTGQVGDIRFGGEQI